MRQPRPKPLILFTPKSLLRFPASFSTLDALEGAGFQPLLNDLEAPKSGVKRLLFCSGKIYYDLQAIRAEHKATDTAVIRVEQLYLFPAEILRSLAASYPSIMDAAWVQEEPHNMGPWTFIEPRLRPLLASSATLRYLGRLPSASPATGNASVHKHELSEVCSMDALE